MRVTVRVYPGARRAVVGGRYGSTEPPVLIVRVCERAVAGRANDAVLAQLAVAFGVPGNEVALVHGTTSRTKIVEVPGATAADLAALLVARGKAADPP